MKTNRNAIYLSSPVNALVEGLYTERTTVAEVLEHGDFGLGTFNRLDGEMVVLDGEVFQMKADGRAHPVSPDEKTPFACVTRFTPDTVDDFPDPPGQDLFDLVGSLLPSRNMLYAIRVDGTFRRVRARSVPPQDSFRPLAEVAREQPEFEFNDIKGSMVGFFTPRFLQGVGVAGPHLHFISADRTVGGHLLSCDPGPVSVHVQHVPCLVLGLPMTVDFLTMEPTRDASRDIEEAE